MPGKPAVFLDRDNTLIRNDGDLGDPAKVELIQGVAMAVASLCGLGFKTVVVTNQGGVARGRYTEADVDAVHDRLAELIEGKANGARIDAFYFCPFHPEGTVAEFKKEHEDRKPSPGMLVKAAAEHRLDLEASWMVGDALRDVAAGRAAGCRTVWLCGDADAREMAKSADEAERPDYVAGNLVEAVRIIASQRHSREEATLASGSTSSGQSHDRRFDAQAVARLQRKDDRGSQQATTSVAEPAPAPTTARPFRPYTLPPEPPADDAPLPAVPAAQPKAQETLGRVLKKVRGRDASKEATDAAAIDPEEDSASAAVVPAAAESTESQADASEDGSTSRAPSAASSRLSDARELTRLCRAILQELRGQRGSGADTGAGLVFAVVLQAIAVIALLAGLWLGAEDDGLFLRWLGVAVVVQLSVIALRAGAWRSR